VLIGRDSTIDDLVFLIVGERQSYEEPPMPATFGQMLIKLREQSHPAILDRDAVIADAEKHLTPWLDLIRDLVNYGTNLIVRCVNSSERKTKDKVILAILLRQAVAMLDGVEVLLSKGATHPANLQMRALFEAYVYIDWILAGDSQRKAQYYTVHNLRRKRLWASRTQTGSPDALEFAAEMGKYGLNITTELQERSREQMKKIDRILALPELASVNADFDAVRAKRKLPREVAWYVPLGPKSVSAIARATGHAALYALLYSAASEVMHSSSEDQHVEFEAGKLTIKPIRFLGGFEPVFRFSVSIALDLYRKILHEYRYEELPAFTRKYVEQWQKQYLSFLKIKYESVEVIAI
jgi:hypothetical protein